MQKILELTENYILLIIVFLLPLTVSTVLPDSVELPKLVLLSFGVMLALAVKALQTLVKGELKISYSPIDLTLALLAVAFVASAIFKTPNKMEAFLFPGTVTGIIAIILLWVLINSSNAKRMLADSLVYAAGTVALISLLSYFKVFQSIPQLPALFKSEQFSLIGGKLSEIIFLTSIIPLAISGILSSTKAVKKTLSSLAIILVITTLVLDLFLVLPGKAGAPVLPSFQGSWSIAIDALKESPIFGIGSGNYLTAFNRFRPISFNSDNLWTLRFTNARNWPFTALTETGLLGLAAMILLGYQVFKLVKNHFKRPGSFRFEKSDLPVISLVLVSVFLLLFPFNLALLVFFFLILVLNIKTKDISLQLSAFMYTNENTGNKTSKFPAFLLATPVLLLALAFFFFGGRALAAEAKYKKAIDSATAGDGKAAYDLLRDTIALNPLVDRYHATYTQVNLALAQNIAQKKNLSDEERNTVTQLVQQAIRESKTTTALNLYRSSNWQLLAQTYQSIIAFAKGADQLAIQYYGQAIALDPYNPTLRISLGGLYFAAGDYDNAITAFTLAVAAKNDLANAHYNLALAYERKNETQKAIDELKNTLALLSKDSKDYVVAKGVLDKLESAKGAKTQGSTGESLTTPPANNNQVINPPVVLPEETPVPTLSPSPSPDATPVP